MEIVVSHIGWDQQEVLGARHLTPSDRTSISPLDSSINFLPGEKKTWARQLPYGCGLVPGIYECIIIGDGLLGSRARIAKSITLDSGG
jgi:hypothetical protein